LVKVRAFKVEGTAVGGVRTTCSHCGGMGVVVKQYGPLFHVAV